MEQNTDKKMSNDKELISNFSIIFPASFSHICKSWFSTEKTAIYKSCERLHGHHEELSIGIY